MMDYVGIVLLACFITVAIACPITCIIYARRRERRKYHPTPKAFQKARKKLGTVTECLEQDEKCAGRDGDRIGDCTICMGALRPASSQGEPYPSTSRQETSTASTSCEKAETSKAEAITSIHPQDEAIAGPATPAPAVPESAVLNGTSPNAAQDKKSRDRAKKAAAPSTPTDMDHEILKLKTCSHVFHSRCLASWFLIERFDCPVCRRYYWTGARQKPLFPGMPPTSYTMTSARMAMGALV